MHKKIKFKISSGKDVESLKAFIQDANFDGGRNLEWAVLKKYPILKKHCNGNGIRDIKFIKLFVLNIYSKHSKIFERNLIAYENNWKKIEDLFHVLIGEIFRNRPWPRGKYIAYMTIWGMFPRFLEDKTFQIPYRRRNKKYVNVVIAHEMLHFLFYDYFYSKYPRYKKDTYNFFTWHVSEIFNELVQNSPQWLSVFSVKTMGYSEHEEIVKRLSKKYYKKDFFDLDSLTKDIIAEVEKI